MGVLGTLSSFSILSLSVRSVDLREHRKERLLILPENIVLLVNVSLFFKPRLGFLVPFNAFQSEILVWFIDQSRGQAF